MTDAENPHDRPAGVSRRAVVRGAAWTAPAVVMAVAVPTASASGCDVTISDPAPLRPYQQGQVVSVDVHQAGGFDLVLTGGATFLDGSTTQHSSSSTTAVAVIAGATSSTLTVTLSGNGACTASVVLPVVGNPVPAARPGLVAGANSGDHGGAGAAGIVSGFQPSDAWIVWGQHDGSAIRAAALAPSGTGGLGAVVLADNSVRLNTGSSILTMPNPDGKTWVDIALVSGNPVTGEAKIMLLSEDGRVSVATATPSGFDTVADAGLPSDAFVVSMTVFGNNGGPALGMAVDTKHRVWTGIGSGSATQVPLSGLKVVEISANLTDFYLRVEDTGRWVSRNGGASVKMSTGAPLQGVYGLAKGNIATRTMAFLTTPSWNGASYFSGVYVTGPNDGKALDFAAPENDVFTSAHPSRSEWGANRGPFGGFAKITALVLGDGTAKALNADGHIWTSGVSTDGASGDSTLPAGSTAPVNVRCTDGAGNPLTGVTGLAASSGRTFLAFGS